ncbi:hypothetical protein BH11ARM2_BH11ARM2_30770 [soil metagenome]
MVHKILTKEDSDTQGSVGVTEWTEADFKADLAEASVRAKIKEAAQEARNEFKAGKVEPFPES